MVLQSVADLDDDVYPGVQDYAKCQSKAFMKGLLGLVAGGGLGLTGSLYARQRFAAKFLPTYTVSAVAGGAIVCGYIAASIASRECQRNWVRTAQAAGYNDDISPPTALSPSLQAPGPGGLADTQHDPRRMSRGSLNQERSTDQGVTSHSAGTDETDAPVFKKTKYGDTMG